MICLDEVRTLLLDSWVTDGRRGFFVDGAHSTASPPFSLYETLWQLRLSQRGGQGTAGLSPASVQAWIGGALDGRLGRCGLPAIAQVDYAVQTLRLVGAPVDHRRAARALARLRSGDRYRTSVLASEPDWGSTAVAVRVQAQLGLPVPSEVIAGAARALRSHDAVTARSLTQVISLLQIAGDLRPQLGCTVPEPALAGLVHAADRRLSGVQADAAWLAQKASLCRAAAQLGVEVAPVSPGSRAQLMSRDGSVTLPGYSSPEPQATYCALELGCCGVRVPPAPAHSRAGWPSPDAAADGLGVSAAAMRAAGEACMDRLFVDPLQRQAREVWLPSIAQTSEQTVSARVDRVNLRILAALIGESLARDVDQALPDREGWQGNDMVMLLNLVALARSSPSPQRLAGTRAFVAAVAERRGATASITLAAWLELASQVFSDPKLHERAAAEARDLRIAPGLYAASVTETGEASLTASTIGTWIERPATDVVPRWAEARLYDPQRLDHLPMRTLAALLAAHRGAYGDLFPIAF